jgi:hypothetical protein
MKQILFTLTLALAFISCGTKSTNTVVDTVKTVDTTITVDSVKVDSIKIDTTVKK